MYRNSLASLPTTIERPDQQPNGAGLRRLYLLPVDWISRFSKEGIQLAMGAEGPIEIQFTKGEASWMDNPAKGANGIFYQPGFSVTIPKTREELTSFFYETSAVRWIALHVDRNNISRVSGTPEFPLQMNFLEGVYNQGGKNGYILSLSGAQPEPSLVVPSISSDFFSSQVLAPQSFHGISSESQLDSAGVLALAFKSYTSAKGRYFSIDGEGKYLYYAYPSAWGEADFLVNGLQNTAWIKQQLSFENSEGLVIPFYVYRSLTVQYGTSISIQVS